MNMQRTPLWLLPLMAAAAVYPRLAAAEPARALEISGAGAAIVEAVMEGPVFRAPSLFLGVEDYHNERIHRLRSGYDFLDAIDGEPSEFRQQLLLRHWVHSQWPIDDSQDFGTDPFEILEKARETGAGFHCSHAMAVQQAVLTSAGFVARDLGVDRDSNVFGRSYHHGVNEVWSNEYAKWVMLDAKYDNHFERDGVPLSALEIHEEARRDGGARVQMVIGPDRMPAPNPAPEEYGPRIDSYWWISYHLRQSPFTQPRFSDRSWMVIPDNEAFQEDTWRRNHGGELTEHWAYEANAFVPIADRHQIEWTPGVTTLARATQPEPGVVTVTPRSATPNLEAYRYRVNSGAWETAEPGEAITWTLTEGENTLEVRTRNRFGVEGPAATATIRYEP